MVYEKYFAYSTTEQLPFLLTVPSDFSAEERLPLIVFLHGAGERGTDFAKIRVHGIPKLFGANPDYRGLRVVTLSPQCPLNDVWNAQPKIVHALIESVIAEYHCDPDRVSITGISMGGFGTWEMAMRYPTLFAAAAPICGGGMSWRTESLKNLPIRAFHGDQDTVVPLEYSLLMVRAVNARGGNAQLTVYPGVAHDSWTPAYEQSDLIEWLIAQKRS